MRRSGKQVRLRMLGGGSEFSGAPRSRVRAVATSAGAFVGGLVVIGIILGVVHNRWHRDRRSDPVLSGTGAILLPAQIGATRARNAVASSWDSLFAGGRLKRDNDRLQAQISQLQQENESLRAKAAEADRLRAALGFAKQQSAPPIAAEVVGWLPTAGVDTIVVARGTHDGVRAGAIARTPTGLVGQVTEAGLFSSQVLLLTDISSNVGALVLHKGKAPSVGILQGTGRGQALDLLYLHIDDDIKPGDQVVSSGYGGVIPPDIPIGTITSVTEDGAHFLKAAKVTPSAPLPGDLREVFLVPALSVPQPDATADGSGASSLPTHLGSLSTPSSPIAPSASASPSPSPTPSPKASGLP